MTESGKQYGLLVPKKTQNLQPRHSIFGDDSDSDTGEGGNSVGKSFKNESVQKRQTKLDIKKALEQDPTVYQYDEVYDEMEEKKLEQRIKKKDPEKKPKYIQALLATAERRKREQERRTERKVQKEREAEGEEFKDKESFVTSAYRKKLEEFQAMDEQERFQDKIEEITDVAKQKDLSGFYRHLYRQKVCDKDEPVPPIVKIKEERDEDKSIELSGGASEEMELKALIPSESVGESSEAVKVEERQYRKRKVSSSSESGSERDAEEKKGKVGEVSDGDSDSSSSESSSGSSSDSSSSSEGSADDDNNKKSKVDSENAVKNKKEENEELKPDNETNENKKKSDHKDINGVDEEQKTEVVNATPGSEIVNEKVPEEPKPNIWEKKTVGQVFDDALQRYLARKAAKMAES